ncbi:hypothetical protein QWY90_12775 [Flavobacterium paronense]|uniref:Outer membrane protein beta-barrel domain-containing protein n=1 Tax=Flavobacterium paronense TaxID=1392775 RepID=A0ABV5GE23_9FLAO|nr:hypothetical protein [Flavobacterium paronense]MDN3678181.1 hypothetical protein [Flavobacterium paronense]
MRVYVLISILFFCCLGYSQETPKQTDVKTPRHTFAKLDFSFPIRVNQYYGEIDPYTGEKEPFFLPDGISTRFGYGLKPIDWIAIGANIGIDWKGSKCLVVAPIFGTLKICPIGGMDLRYFVEAGYGRALALGKNDLAGYFKKISIGIEDKDSGGFGLYLELCQYGFSKITDEKIGSFCVGLTYQFK